MADLQNITPVYYDSETKTHKPMGEGQVVDPKLIALSADDANILETHDDGLYVPAPAAPEPVTAQDLLSADKPNYLRLGNDGKLKVDGNDVLSNGGSNLLTINPVDNKIQLDEDTLRSSLHIVSGDKGNVIVEGSDKGAYLSLDDLLADSGILYKDQQGKLNAGLSLGYNNLTGKLSLYGNEGNNELSSVVVVAQGSMLIGAEFTHGMPSKEGEDERTGDYHVSLSASYNGAYDGGAGLLFKGLHKGTKNDTPLDFTYQLFNPSHDDQWPHTWEAFFNGEAQSGAVENEQGQFTATFADQSKLEITDFNQTDLKITGKATFTPGIGIKKGYFLHMIFRLASGVITDTYLDFTDIVAFYAGCGINIVEDYNSGKKTISVVTSDDGGVQCDTGKLSLKLNAECGLQTDENGLALKVPEADSGLIIDDTGLHVDLDWMQANALTEENIKAGDGITVSFEESREEGSATVSAKLKATNPGLDVNADGLSVLLSESGGLTATVYGLAVNLRGDGALSRNERGLGVKTKPAGGLDISGDGIGINEEWLKQHAITEDTVKAGNGIDVQVTEDGSATVSAKVQESGGLEATAGGLAVKPATNGGLESTENGLGVKTDTNGGLESTEEGLKVKTNTDGGLQSTEAGLGIDEGWLKEHAITEDTIKAGNGIEVTVDEAGGSAKVSAKVQENGGLEVTEAGLAVKEAANSGLESTSDGLAVKKKEDGGLTSGADGLGIDDGWLKKHAITDQTIVAGNGIAVEVTEGGSATISAKPKANGGITVDDQGISVQTKTDGGITVGNDGLSIHVKEGDSLAVGSDGLYVTVAETAEPAPKDTDVITYGWLKEHLKDVLKDMLDTPGALSITDEGKLKVVVVSANEGNLLGRGSDYGAYMNGDLNEGPDSDQVRNGNG